MEIANLVLSSVNLILAASICCILLAQSNRRTR